MKQKLATFLVAAAILTGLTIFNATFAPDKKAAEQKEKEKKAQEQLEKIHKETEEHAHEEHAESAAPASGGQPDKAPDVFKVKFETTKGGVVIEVHKDWAPIGAQRFYELVRQDFFRDMRIFRVIPGFAAQFGISGDPRVTAQWHARRMADDPAAAQSNKKGYVSFAHGGPGTRDTQIFINLGDNPQLDSAGFPPFAKVIQGMDVVEQWNAQYGGAPSELQTQIRMEGNAFLDKHFPGLDSITKASLID